MLDDAQFRLKHLTAHKGNDGKPRCPIDRTGLSVVELRTIWLRQSPGVYAITPTSIVRPRRNLKLVHVPVNIRDTSLKG